MIVHYIFFYLLILIFISSLSLVLYQFSRNRILNGLFMFRLVLNWFKLPRNLSFSLEICFCLVSSVYQQKTIILKNWKIIFTFIFILFLRDYKCRELINQSCSLKHGFVWIMEKAHLLIKLSFWTVNCCLQNLKNYLCAAKLILRAYWP